MTANPVPSTRSAFPGGRRGFSFLEVLLVLAILAIIASLALPMLGSTETSQLRAAAELLEADLDFARIGSITHPDAPRLIVFDTADNAYHIAAAADPATALTNPADRLPYAVRFGEGRARSLTAVAIQSVSVGGDDRLRFGPYGQLDQGAAAQITLATADHTLTLTVDPVSGEVTIGQIQ